MAITRRERIKCDTIMDGYLRGNKLLDKPKPDEMLTPKFQSINVAAFTAMAMDLAKVLKVPLKRSVATTVILSMLNVKFAGTRVGSKFVTYDKADWTVTFLNVVRLCQSVAGYIAHQRD